MKAISIYIIKSSFLLVSLVVLKSISFGQGRVVINEFMPWSGCSTTSEYIELLNFGPGPMDVGCFIVTNGQYAVTIPQNTSIQAGQYLVLSGQNSLAQNCGNTDSIIQVDLNWTTCNCTDKPIPTSGDGFLKNGGSSNEKIVLLDPNLNVLDAVSRSSTPSASVSITTASNGSCSGKTFNLDLMNITYESINKSTGIDNSFARRVDGDCGWVKTTAISADAPNKTGNTSSASYNFSTLSASDCNSSTGSISISVNAPDVVTLFPMTYTLAFDSDSNNLFQDSDQYIYGLDSSASSIDINNLEYGRYRTTVGSVSGCNLKSFDFFIFNCYGVILPHKTILFQYEGTKEGKDFFTTKITGIENLKTIILEGGNGEYYSPVSTIYNLPLQESEQFKIATPQSSNTFFRLKLVDKSNLVIYSKEIRIYRPLVNSNLLWPNPCKDKVHIQMNSSVYKQSYYTIYNSMGMLVRKSRIDLQTGSNIISIQTDNLDTGIYNILIEGEAKEFRNQFKFIKQ